MGLKKVATEKFFIADQTYENVLIRVAVFLVYSEALLQLPEEHNIIFIPGSHCNQSSIEIFFSRLRNLDKDRTDLYGGSVLQYNVMNDIYASNKKRKVGNSSYLEWMIHEENIPMRKEMRIGSTVIKNSSRINLLLGEVLGSLPGYNTSTTILSSEFKSIGSAFGFLFKEDLLLLTLPNGQNYQRYCISNPFFQGYYSLVLDTKYEQWFVEFTSVQSMNNINVLCRVITVKLFHLFEDSLLQLEKSRVSFQLNILIFVQSKDIKTILGNISPGFGHSRGCLLVLFIFLSRWMIDIWLPDVINRYKQKSK